MEGAAGVAGSEASCAAGADCSATQASCGDMPAIASLTGPPKEYHATVIPTPTPKVISKPRGEDDLRLIFRSRRCSVRVAKGSSSRSPGFNADDSIGPLIGSVPEG